MSDTHICIIHGTCKSVTEEHGFTKFSIDVGRQYPVQLSTKKADIIAKARAVYDSGNIGSWKYQLSLGGPNPHKPGTHFKNRMLEDVREGQHGTPTIHEPELEGSGGGQPQATPQAQPQSSGAPAAQQQTYTQNDLHPESVRRIEEAGRRGVHEKAWEIAVECLRPTFTSGEPPEALFARVQTFQRKVATDIGGQWAMDRDPSYLPESLRPNSADEPAHTGGETTSWSSDPAPSDDWSDHPEAQRPPDDDIPF